MDIKIRHALVDEAPRHGMSVIGHARGALGATESVEAGQVVVNW